MTEVSNQPPINPESFPKIGGIPVDFAQIAKVPGQEVQVRGEISGDRISIHANKNSVNILDLDDQTLGLSIEFYDIPDELDPEEITNRIDINVRTVSEKTGERVRNPDLRARDLIFAGIHYLESLHGPINSIIFEFPGEKYEKQSRFGSGKKVPSSDNYAAYFEEKEQAKARLLQEGVPEEEADEKAKEAGVKATWAYQSIALPLGLSRVRDIDEVGMELGIETSISGEFIRELPTQE